MIIPTSVAGRCSSGALAEQRAIRAKEVARSRRWNAGREAKARAISGSGARGAKRTASAAARLPAFRRLVLRGAGVMVHARHEIRGNYGNRAMLLAGVDSP